MQFKILLTGVALLFATSVNAHPDGATPYWYPTTYLYGFVSGCWETVEQNQALQRECGLMTYVQYVVV